MMWSLKQVTRLKNHIKIILNVLRRRKNVSRGVTKEMMKKYFSNENIFRQHSSSVDRDDDGAAS